MNHSIVRLNDKDEFLRAVKLSYRAHANQKDKDGLKYFFHPMRVAISILNETKDYQLATIAILHDIIEDTDCTLRSLKKLNFPQYILIAVDLLTKRKNVSYERYLDRISANKLAIKVKIKDLKDNLRCDRGRTHNINKDKYILALKKMESALAKIETLYDFR